MTKVSQFFGGEKKTFYLGWSYLNHTSINLKSNVMTNKEESRLSMYLIFQNFSKAYTAITNALPNYTTNSAAFDNSVIQIQSIAGQQKTSTKGFADAKKQLREKLMVLVADNARKLGVYAKFTNNATLAQEVNFSESKLRQVPDTAVKDYAQIAYNLAQANIAALATYGITPATQTALLAAINAYNASIGKPGASKTESVKITRQLKNLFKTAEAALANMDAAVEIVRLTQPDFYKSYKNARKVVVTGTSSLAVKGLVTDATTGEPLKGVTLLFNLNGHNGSAKMAAKANSESIVKKTAVKGGFIIKSLPAGVYAVTVNKTGYTDQDLTVAVAEGELAVLNVQLAKN